MVDKIPKTLTSIAHLKGRYKETTQSSGLNSEQVNTPCSCSMMEVTVSDEIQNHSFCVNEITPSDVVMRS